MTSLFFSYSHADETLRDELEKHLSLLSREGRIRTWHDRRIVPGENIGGAISDNLESAEIIILLVSPDFVASDYCYDVEMRRAMEKHREGTVAVVPVILRHCDWKAAPFGELLGVPKDGKPIASYSDRDEAFVDVVESIKKLLPSNATQGETVSVAPSPSVKPETGAEAPRSSNLRVRKTVTDQDVDNFISSSIDFFKEFFKSSLSELEERHREVTTSCETSNDDLRCIIYLDGQRSAQCCIFVSRAFGDSGIGFSENIGGDRNAFNDHLVVAHEDGDLFFPSHFPVFGNGSQHSERMMREEAAEHLWGRLVAPIQ